MQDSQAPDVRGLEAEAYLLLPRRHRGLRRSPGVVVHTRPDDEDIPTMWRDGMPLTAPARTLIDIANRIQPEQMSMAVRQVLRRGLLTVDQLAGVSPRELRRIHSVLPRA